MANQEHLDIFWKCLGSRYGGRNGKETWDEWRAKHPAIQLDFSDAEFDGFGGSAINLSKIDCCGAILANADFTNTYFSGANLSDAFMVFSNFSGVDFSNATLIDADLSGSCFQNANFTGADLRGAIFSQPHVNGFETKNADLRGVNFRGANLSGTDLSEINLSGANLSNANLRGADLRGANLCDANLRGADLTRCHIYGISAWNVKLEEAQQENLIVTRDDEPEITVDNLKVAQFIYLLLNNTEIRDVIDTIAKKVVLILGRFTPERKAVLDAVRNELRHHNYSPVVFDFEKPSSRDFTETVRTLAHMSKFILADLTEPSSIPQELQATVPDLAVPVQPLLEESKREYAMFVDFRKYHWVLPIYFYKDQATLLASLKTQIIDQAEEKVEEIALEKAKILECRDKKI